MQMQTHTQACSCSKGLHSHAHVVKLSHSFPSAEWGSRQHVEVPLIHPCRRCGSPAETRTVLFISEASWPLHRPQAVVMREEKGLLLHRAQISELTWFSGWTSCLSFSPLPFLGSCILTPSLSFSHSLSFSLLSLSYTFFLSTSLTHSYFALL